MVELNHAALDFLLNRRSCHRLREPGPSPDEIQILMQAALRAPDFQHLRPFRFLAAQAAGLDRLGEAFRQAALASAQSKETLERAPRMPHRAPLVITAVFSPKPSPAVSFLDQELSAGCAVLMMQMAARALGYGGVWRSGWPCSVSSLGSSLGLSEAEQIIGFLYLGTPAQTELPKTLATEEPPCLLGWL